MSRDAVGRSPLGPGAGAPGTARSPEDLDAAPPAPEQAGAAPRAARRRRGRTVLALALAAAVGAGTALVAVRAAAQDDVDLVVVGSYASTSSWASSSTGPQDVAVQLLVASTGSTDAVALAGGTGEGDAAVSGTVRQDPYQSEDDVGDDPALTAGTVTSLVLLLEVDCDDVPAWEPWLEVRTAAGATPRVPLVVLAEAELYGSDPLEQGCGDGSASGSEAFVVDARREPGDVLVLEFASGSPVEQRLEVVDGGAVGLSFAEADVVLPPYGSTVVEIRVEPTDCAAALASADVLGGARVSVTPVEAEEGSPGAEGRRVRLDGTPGTAVGVEIGRRCATAG